MTQDASSPARSPQKEDRIRVTSIAGTIASLVIVAAFFLPWVQVPKEEAVRYRDQMTSRMARNDPPLPAGVPEDDWRLLSETVAQEGHVTGLDIFYWARTAVMTADAYARQGAGEEDPSIQELPRGIHVAAIALAALPVAAVLLVFYFLLLFLRRAHSPALVVAVLNGTLAVSMPATYEIIREGIGVPTTPGDGLTLTGLAGALLFLAGVFGVRLRNWWRVILGAVLLGGGLALAAWQYVMAA